MLKEKIKDIKTGLFLKKYWYLFAMGLIAALSFTLDFYATSKVGYGNAYYAAAIKSMTQSFKNFFFVSFDPAGLVSVDKPPLGLWVQAVFVLVFGYHGWAMLLPQALAATGSCLMMYILTAKRFGRPAGLISAFVFALTPAVVVAARNNTMDMQLIFVLLVAVWFLFKALDTSKWHYLFLCALFIGLGFNVKMLQAYMILPAIAIVYLVFSKEKWPRKIAASALSLLIIAVVSFAWVAAVDLTPASNRPYVGSSTNNTVRELIVGHNGLERVYGQTGGMGGVGKGNGGNFGAPAGGQNQQGGPGGQNQQGSPGGQNQQGGPGMGNGQGAGTQTGGQNGTNNGTNNGTPPTMPGQNQKGQQGGPGGGMGGGGNDIGTAGILRLWSSSDYGQASWLIVLALFCIAAKIRKVDLKKLTASQGLFSFWVIWLLTMYGFFSFAGFWHRYYLCMFAPAIAGLVGPGIVAMARQFKNKNGWRKFLLPGSLLVTFIIEFVYVWSYSALRIWLVPVMIVTAVVSLILMAVHYSNPKRLVLLLSVGAMMVSLLAAPLYWCSTVIIYPSQNSTMPYAGPELASTASVPGMTSNQEPLTSGDSGTIALEKYLVKHYKTGSYLVVSQRADDVAQFIVDTGLPAVAYGGFLGTDNAMSLSRLKQLVKEGKVTYFLVSGSGGNSNSELTSYVEQHATKISSSEYGVTALTAQNGSSNGISGSTLYLFK